MPSAHLATRLATRLAAALALVAAFASPTLAQQPSEQVQLSLERYGELLRVARRADGPRPTWSRGTVRVELPADGARPATVSVDTSVKLTGDGTAEVAILPAQAVVQSATGDGSELPLVQIGGAHVALLSGNDTVRLRLQYLVPRDTDADGAPIAVVPLPPMPGAALTVTGVGDGAAVYPGVDVQKSGGTVTASLPASPAVVVRSGAAGGGHTVRRVAYRLTPDAGNGADVDATYEVSLDGRSADLRLARADSALVDAREGRDALSTRVIDGWHTARVTGRGSHTVTARFRVAIDRSQGQPQIVLHPDEVPIAQVDMTVPGKAEITVEPPIPVNATITGDGERARTAARAYLPPTEEVALKWTEARAAAETKVRVNTETYQLLTLEEGVLRSRVLARYDVIYGKLRELPIRLPEGVVPYKVIGEGIEDWRVLPATDDLPRHVRVILGEELSGKLAIELQIEVPVAPVEGTGINLPLVQPVETEDIVIRQQGVVALFDGDKVGFAPGTANGYSKVGADALPSDVRQTLRDKVNQAFKHLQAPGPISSAVAAAKAKESRFDARVDTLYLVREQTLTAQASVLVEVKSGRNDTLHVSIPQGIAEPRITGPSINKVELAEGFDAGEGRQAWRVTFTQALEGAILLDVEFELLLPKELGAMKVPDLLVHGAEVQSGSFGIAAEGGMEVREKTRTDVRPAAVTDLPKAVRLRSDLEIRAGYQYARAPWGLEVDVKAHSMVETLDAEAEQVRIETNVLESGYVVGRATYVVDNDDRQYFRVALPEGASPLRVTINGARMDEVRNDEGAEGGTTEAGKIAIPLPKNATTRIEVSWEGRRDALGVFDGLDLRAPRADVRSKNIQWLLQLPGDRGVVGLDSDMKRIEVYNWEALSSGDALPVDGSSQGILLTQPVHSAEDPALAVSMTLTAALGPEVGSVFIIVGLIALVLFVRVRAGGRPVNGGHWLLLVVGLGALVIKAAVWEFEVVEGLVVIVAVLAMGIAARRGRKAREAS